MKYFMENPLPVSIMVIAWAKGLIHKDPGIRYADEMVFYGQMRLSERSQRFDRRAAVLSAVMQVPVA
jgi:hypothetical protein